MTRIRAGELLGIGELARRAGVSVPTIRYYEERGLIRSERTSGNRRRFPRHELRRLAVVAAGQVVGLSLQEIADAMSQLPVDRPPTEREWERMSRAWAELVQGRIRRLQALATALDGCIGCGCLSLGRCMLFNPADEAAHEGPGSRWLRAARGQG